MDQVNWIREENEAALQKSIFLSAGFEGSTDKKKRKIHCGLSGQYRVDVTDFGNFLSFFICNIFAFFFLTVLFTCTKTRSF